MTIANVSGDKSILEDLEAGDKSGRCTKDVQKVIIANVSGDKSILEDLEADDKSGTVMIR